MNPMTDVDRRITAMASIRLGGGQLLTSQQISQAVDELSRMYPDDAVNTEMIVRELESQFSVVVGHVQVLQDDSDHIIWLSNRKAEIDWSFWGRYELWMRTKGMPESVVRSVDEITDEILGRIEDPHRPSAWDRRGMVVGHVQSGKTANYAGLINKALDAGYKLIIVLAGMHNNLRSQTQLRLDHDVRGYDSQVSRTADDSVPGIGVGTIDRRSIVHTLTDSSELGDFRRNRAVNFTPGGDPLLLVLKKNASVLRHVLTWLRSYATADEANPEQKVLNSLPLLLIDDEADNASVDGRAAPRDENGLPLVDSEPTTINRLIRQILKCFEKKGYVGYTATPFANIFIYPSGDTDLSGPYGEDLFPRSFIINLPAPSDHVGPVQVFGLQDDVHAGIGGNDGLPVVRIVEDHQPSIPTGHKKGWVPYELPLSLQQAVRSFWLSSAARRARGQVGEHNSMLIHVTRFTDVQERVMDLVREEVYALRRRMRFGDGSAPPLLGELEQLWDVDFLPTTAAIHTAVCDPSITPLAWTDVEPHLRSVIESVEFRIVNGSAKDALDYYEHKEGLTVIAVGGDKLSRGLTLEGLSVSYYLRHSTMYDTLLQMGRWFGYRHGYLDLCRLYMSTELRDWYGYITLAYEELRREFDVMVACGGTPQDYGLKIRTHPAGLQITATNKLRNTTRLQVTFEDSMVETFAFHKDLQIIGRNFSHLETWLRGLGAHSEVKNGNYLWHDVAAQRVIDLIQSLAVHPHVRRASPGTLCDFISRHAAKGKITNWTVALISNQTGTQMTVAGIEDIGLTKRKDVTPDEPEKYSMSKNRLVNPADESLDLDDTQLQKALEKTNEGRTELLTVPSGRAVREIRTEEHGLLLIYPLDPIEPLRDPDASVPFVGFALSFPAIRGATPVEYAVDAIYMQLFGDEE